jgi:hypothetical protein
VFFYSIRHRDNHRQKKTLKKQHWHFKTYAKPGKKTKGCPKYATKPISGKVLFAVKCKCILGKYGTRIGNPDRDYSIPQYTAKT